MSTLHTLAAPFADCNLHLCLYGSLGALLVARAALAVRERRHDEAREQGFHGVVYILLGMLP